MILRREVLVLLHILYSEYSVQYWIICGNPPLPNDPNQWMFESSDMERITAGWLKNSCDTDQETSCQASSGLVRPRQASMASSLHNQVRASQRLPLSQMAKIGDWSTDHAQLAGSCWSKGERSEHGGGEAHVPHGSRIRLHLFCPFSSESRGIVNGWPGGLTPEPRS